MPPWSERQQDFVLSHALTVIRPPVTRWLQCSNLTGCQFSTAEEAVLIEIADKHIALVHGGGKGRWNSRI